MGFMGDRGVDEAGGDLLLRAVRLRSSGCGLPGGRASGRSAPEVLDAERPDLATDRWVDADGLCGLLQDCVQHGLSLEMACVSAVGRCLISFEPQRVVPAAQAARWRVEGPDVVWEVDESRLGGLRLVQRPSCRGLHLRLELFDADGVRVASLGAQPRPQRPDPCLWRALLERHLGVALC